MQLLSKIIDWLLSKIIDWPVNKLLSGNEKTKKKLTKKNNTPDF